jgi:hypothetical protein
MQLTAACVVMLPLSKTFLIFSGKTPIPVAVTLQYLLQLHRIFRYDGSYVIKRARVYTGWLVPQSSSHDHCP